MKKFLYGIETERVQRQNRRLFIYCAGGLGREVLKLARVINGRKPHWDEIIFLDDRPNATNINGAKVLSFEDYLSTAGEYQDQFVIATGEPKIKRSLAEKLLANSCQLINLIHPDFCSSSFHTIAKGAIIAEGNIFTDNIKVGFCAHLNLRCTVGHDVIIGNYTTISPGTIISGDVAIGEGTYIGTGAIIRDEVRIGKNCIIGMGSLVTKDIPDGVVAYGSPCKVIRKNESKIVFQ